MSNLKILLALATEAKPWPFSLKLVLVTSLDVIEEVWYSHLGFLVKLQHSAILVIVTFGPVELFATLRTYTVGSVDKYV